jgi:hypothetical protein
VREQDVWRASRKADEVGAVDETGGVQPEDSLRAVRVRCAAGKGGLGAAAATAAAAVCCRF